MAIKKTTEEFIEQLNIRNQRYSDRPLILVQGQEYISTYAKLNFKCVHNHTFEASPHNVLNGRDCKQCSITTTRSKNTKGHSEFLIKLENRNNQFTNSIVLKDGEIYKGTYVKLMFVCERNHEFLTLPKTIVRGSGCPQCKVTNNIHRHSYTTDQFVGLLSARNISLPHKQVFLNEHDVYNGFRNKLSFYCDQNHVWSTTPDNVLNGKSGCPQCAASKSFSYMAIDWLDTISSQQSIKITHQGNAGLEFQIPGTRYKADGYCDQNNTIYEFYGNYWHGNPRLFGSLEVNEVANKTFGELYSDTISREQIIRQLGYNLVTIWEDEYDQAKILEQSYQDFQSLKNVTKSNIVLIPLTPYDKNKYINQLNTSLSNNQQSIFIFEDEWIANRDLIVSKLTHLSHNTVQPTIHARKCEVRPIVDKKEKSQLLNMNHLQGNDNSQIAYGAYFDNTLVAIMTFSPPRQGIGNYKNKQPGLFELVRFCTNVNYRIPGIASKLLTHFKRNHTWTEIYSYADKRWSIGNMYHQLGFDLVADNPPDYFYVVDGKRKHRWNYRKDILKNTLPNYDPALTEYQNMQNHGFWRVWDCGTLRFSVKNI